jgi:hypothetical protein
MQLNFGRCLLSSCSPACYQEVGVIGEITHWQTHSVRGFLSIAAKKHWLIRKNW